ncbi:MAG: FAD-dependent oxidoreductase [Nitrospiraceae bacterium]|jgi:uncharacterized protein with NAD-binding domain and iron-sulfur cluster|nr:FAD-dependent oxidoreductase [Nitrospiraceae bacterium]
MVREIEESLAAGSFGTGRRVTVPTIYIVGAGLSGMALAESLSRPERGAPVRIVLLEGRPSPGGRVSSYRESHTGQWTDNGQHLFMDVYSSMLSFLDRLGTRSRIVFPTPFSIDLLDGNNRPHPFSLDPKLGKIGGLLGVLSFSGLSLASRLSMLRVGARMSSGMLKEEMIDHLDAKTFLLNSGATHESIDRFWELLVVSATNLSASDVSAALLLRILRETLFGPGPSLIGWSSVSHRELVIDPALALFERRGVEVRCKSAVGRINLSGNRVSSIVVGESELPLSPTDHLVLAVPPWSLERILPIEMMDGELCQNIMRISFSSGIVSIHLWFSGPVVLPAIGGFMSGPIHWVFNKEMMGHPASSGEKLPEGENYLSLSYEGKKAGWRGSSFLSLTVSGVEAKDETSEEEWLDRALLAVGRFSRGPLPGLVHHRVIREKMSTPILGPGQSLYRPSNQTGVPNMWLCGDTTDTGLPATMESAVRSAHVLGETLFPLLHPGCGRQ